MSFNIFDGIKSIPLSSWRLNDYEEQSTLSGLYATVPYLYSAIRARMDGVQATPWHLYPFGSRRDDTDPVTDDYPDLVAKIEDLLPRTEGSICLHGRSYWLIDTNRYGKNPTPRWAVPTSITPKHDTRLGLIGFNRNHSDGSVYFPLDERGVAKGLVWFWLPSLFREEWPDIAPAMVALRDAASSGALSEFVERFFRRGAIKQTLLRVPDDSDAREVERLQKWWERLFRGSRSSGEAQVLREGVEPTVIGEGVSDLSNEDLDQMLRRHISTAMGVPESILVSSASNYAVSQQDWLTFWELTINPSCKRLQRIINQQFLRQFDVYMWFEPERMEFYQRAEVEKAQSLTALVGAGLITNEEARETLGYAPLPAKEEQAAQPQQVPLTDAILNSGALSVNELRERLGLEPVDATEDEQQRTLSRQFELLKQATDAGLTVEQGAELVGLALPEKAEETDDSNDDDEFDEMDAEATAEFDEDEEISATLEATEQRIVRATKSVGDLTARERLIYDAVLKLLEQYRPSMVSAVLNGEPPDFGALSDDLREALIPILEQVTLQDAETLLIDIGRADTVPLDELQPLAATWAQDYGYDLVRQLSNTNRTVLQDAIAQFMSMPEMTRQDIEGVLANTFGPVRATMIAVTETTRAASAATNLTKQHMQQKYNLRYERVWRTNNDELVCPVCGPLNGKPESEWMAEFPDGAPAHPNCRCSTTLRMV